MALNHTTLPNGMTIAYINAGEAALMYREIFTDRCYMQHGISLRPGDVVFDVGANIGMAALFFHSESPDIEVYAFEPAPDPFSALAENMSTHGMRGLPRRVAVTSSSGECEFGYYPRVTGMSGLYADAAADEELTRAFLRNNGIVNEEDLDMMLAGKYQQEVIAVRSVTLSEAITSAGVPSVSLLKVDVEKSEIEVLDGLADEDWPKVRQVAIEAHEIDGAIARISECLLKQKFDVAIEQDKQLAGTEIWQIFGTRQSG